MRRNDDSGAALITVVVLGFVLMVLVATGLTVATSGLRQAVSVQRSTSALDAAYAGVQDYLARVNLSDGYISYGNPDSTFSASSGLIRPDGTNGRPPWNPAFGVGVPNGVASHDRYTTWATVPGSAASAGDSVAKFRYEVDKSQYTSSGIIRLRVTGLAGTRTRTILASLRVKGFVDYAYFTDYEIKDPATFVSSDTTFDPTTCAVYAWSAAGRPAKCSTGDTNMQVTFKSDDVLYGDVHTNDTPSLTCGMTVSGNFETSTPTSKTAVYNKARSCSPVIPIKYADTLPMPATNSSMKQDAECLYTGPTQITYNSLTGMMNVISPWTRNTGGTNAQCGTPQGNLASATGATVPQLDQNLLYVQNVPASSTDPNYWAPTAKPSAVTCIAADGTSTSAANGIGWSVGSGALQTRYPLAGESPATSWKTTSTPAQWSTTTPAYGCRNGDLYVSGGVSTLTTAGSENYVYVVGDITYADRTADLLGLVGQSSVIVWNPMSTADRPMLSQVNLEIDAAMVSVAHTFQVQNNDRGSTRGRLTVFGSIAQKYRGSVASAYIQTDSNGVQSVVYTGYTKGYQYDTLLKTVSPPFFLEPSATSYSVIRYGTVPTAFTPTGAQAS